MTLSKISSALSKFFFETRATPILGWMRIIYSVLLFGNIALLSKDALFFFGPNGAIDHQAGKGIIDPDVVGLFDVLPQSDITVIVIFSLLLIQTVLLGVGFKSRFQAFCIFLYLASIQHRNIMVFDGEDVIFRLFAFFFCVSAAGSYLSLDNLIKKKNQHPKSFPFGDFAFFKFK